MKATLNQTLKCISALTDKVAEFVNANGGFINTQNPDDKCDNIYGYRIDWGLDEIIEERVIAVRVIDNQLMALLDNQRLNYSEPIDFTDYSDKDWYYIGTCGDSVLTAPTILSIASAIEEYV